MKLYLLTQITVSGYDVYTEAVVAANNEKQAREIHPAGGVYFDYERKAWLYSDGLVYQGSGSVFLDWPKHPLYVTATLIGDYIDSDPFYAGRVICASFYAG